MNEEGEGRWRDAGAPLLLRRLVAEVAVDEAHQERGEDDPGELVPVEEREAEERGGGAGVERGEEKAEVGQQKKELPAKFTRWPGLLWWEHVA